MTDHHTEPLPADASRIALRREISKFTDTPEDKKKLDAAEVRLVKLGLGQEVAESFVAKLSHATLMSRVRRDRQQRVNAGYLDNHRFDPTGTYMPPEALVFTGTRSEIAHFMKTVVEIAEMRFAEESHHNYRMKDHVAFDIGHCDQFGDWDAPRELDALVSTAVDRERLMQIDGVSDVGVVLHDRDHPHTAYEFHRCVGEEAGWHSCLAIRKRPIADVSFQLEDHDPLAVEIFRHSSFLMSAQVAHVDEHAGLYHVLQAAEVMSSTHPGKVSRRMREKRDGAIKFLSTVLVEPGKSQQALVIPCSTGYIMRIRDTKRCP